MRVSGLSRKGKGDLAELKVAADLIARGYQLAIPYGEDCDFDLVLCRGERPERVQVKYACSDGVAITVRAGSQSLTNGRVRAVKLYTARTIEWLAIYDRTTDRCYYVPAAELGEGVNYVTLRLVPARNNQRLRIRAASDYLEIPPMEPAGLEPATFRVQGGRSPN